MPSSDCYYGGITANKGAGSLSKIGNRIQQIAATSCSKKQLPAVSISVNVETIKTCSKERLTVNYWETLGVVEET